MSFFERIKEGLKKTRKKFFEGLRGILKFFVRVDESFLDELEEVLISADISVSTAKKIRDRLCDRAKIENVTNSEGVLSILKSIIKDILSSDKDEKTEIMQPMIILAVGVNGTGKTTTLGKLAYKLTREKKKVLLVAADTFRAAAGDQLKIWGERAGCEVISGEEGSDPGSVVFKAIKKGTSENFDVILCDTAGRLHNKNGLMEELVKIERIIGKNLPEHNCEILLVVDASTGQNAVTQAEEFAKATNVSAIVLTKLDGTARGGVVISIKDKLGIPIKFVGVGEKIDDLHEFNPEKFTEALFS
jgi:fused signal recognition particle receptor